MSQDLLAFALHVERLHLDQFWSSVRKQQLREKPETVAQGLLAAFLSDARNRGSVLRELKTGRGFIDLLVRRRGREHVIELKVVKSGGVSGAKQVAAYARQLGHSEAWLVVFDARRRPRRSLSTHDRSVDDVVVHVVVVDINPPVPSSLG